MGNIDMDPLQKQMLDDVFDAFTMLTSASCVSLMHVEGGYTRYSQSAVELFGLPGEYIANGAMDWNDYLHPEDRKRYMTVMGALLDGGAQTYDITYRVRLATGEFSTFRAIGAVLRGADGRPSLIGGTMGNLGVASNIDPVTALPDKEAYKRDLANLLREGRDSISLQVGFDRLAHFNETYGYTYGNRVLQEAAWMIQEVVKDRGSIYRLYGAAFAVLTQTMTRDEISAVYDMIRYRFQRGIQVGGVRNNLLGHGGLVSTHGLRADVDTLYSCLNYAYEESGGHAHGELVDFNGSVNYEGTGSLEMLNAIRECAAEGCEGFVLRYDPVISAFDGHVNGAEAVVCWEDERYGLVEPDAFMPILERDFIFEEVGDFILERGLADGARFLQADPDYLLCLNVYRIQLESDYFVDNLVHFLGETGFPARQLSLKLDVNCRHVEAGRLADTIGRLHEEGILVIIDGFGSGTDSISFLKDYPFDAVSIDRSFADGVKENRRDHDILEYLTRLAATCVEHVNVKGVDDVELRALVGGFPITTMQGRCFSGLLSVEEMVEKYYR